MTLLDLLVKAAGVPAAKILKILQAAAASVPDLAPVIDGLITKLGEPLSLVKLMELVGVLVGEAKNIAKGKLDPRDHPSDLS